MKIYQAFQKLLVGDRDRQTGDLISLLSFLEFKLKSYDRPQTHIPQYWKLLTEGEYI
jgi:hypothetical protein